MYVCHCVFSFLCLLLPFFFFVFFCFVLFLFFPGGGGGGGRCFVVNLSVVFVALFWFSLEFCLRFCEMNYVECCFAGCVCVCVCVCLCVCVCVCPCVCVCVCLCAYGYKLRGTLKTSFKFKDKKQTSFGFHHIQRLVKVLTLVQTLSNCRCFLRVVKLVRRWD